MMYITDLQVTPVAYKSYVHHVEQIVKRRETEEAVKLITANIEATVDCKCELDALPVGLG
jgi:hypothetical protein